MPDEKHPIPQSAVLAYRTKKGKLEVALVTSLDSGRWVIPKGHINNGMNARKSAEQEAFEEAGLLGSVDKSSVGHYTYNKTELKGSGLCDVEVFPMRVDEVVEDFPEKDQRERKWMSPAKAAEVVDEKALRKLILKFGKQMAD